MDVDLNSNVETDSAESQGGAIEHSKGLWIQAAGQLLHRPKAIFGITVLLLLYGGGILAPWLAPQGYSEQDLFAVRQGPSADHLLGTDFVGRDVLSRTIYSLRTNLIITAASVATGALVIGVSYASHNPDRAGDPGAAERRCDLDRQRVRLVSPDRSRSERDEEYEDEPACNSSACHAAKHRGSPGGQGASGSPIASLGRR